MVVIQRLLILLALNWSINSLLLAAAGPLVGRGPVVSPKVSSQVQPVAKSAVPVKSAVAPVVAPVVVPVSTQILNKESDIIGILSGISSDGVADLTRHTTAIENTINAIQVQGQK